MDNLFQATTRSGASQGALNAGSTCQQSSETFLRDENETKTITFRIKDGKSAKIVVTRKHDALSQNGQ